MAAYDTQSAATAASGRRSQRGWYDRWHADYDSLRRQLIPPFDAYYGTAVEVAGLGRGDGTGCRVLDLGAGTGLLSAAVADHLPQAELVLLDEAVGMFDQARERFAGSEQKVDYVVATFAEPWPNESVDDGGGYDVVVSGLAIHHLTDAAKQELFARIYGVLRPGGVFVNAEQIAGPTPALDKLNVSRWYHQIAELGITEEQRIQADLRMADDLPSTVEDQVRWLREVGFAEADCIFKQWRFAVYAGWRNQVLGIEMPKDSMKEVDCDQ